MAIPNMAIAQLVNNSAYSMSQIFVGKQIQIDNAIASQIRSNTIGSELYRAPSVMYEAEATTPKLSTGQKVVKVSTDVLEVGMPAATLVYALCIKDWTGLKQGAFTAITVTGVTYMLKFATAKRRPDGSDSMSFPSFHSASCFADAAFVQRRYGWKLGAPAYALAAYVGWGRIFARKHDWRDVLFGALIGAGSAYIYTRPFVKKHELLISPATDGENIGVTASMKF